MSAVYRLVMNADVQDVSDTASWRCPRIREVADSMHIRLYTVDAITIPAGRWRSQNVLDPFWRFYRNEDDGAYITVRSEAEAGDSSSYRYRLEPGRCYFVPAGVRFSCGCDAAFRHFYMHFDVTGLPPLLMRALFAAPVVLPGDVDEEARVAAFADRVRESHRLDLIGQCQAKALLYEGLAHYLDRALPEASERLAHAAEAQEAVAPALEFIDAHLSQTMSISDLAARCCLSPDYFARRFKAGLDQTPGDYVRDRRVARAAQLLLFTGHSLDAIAEACGFGSRFYLTRVFTRRMGIPPAAYRKVGPRI